MHIIFIYIYYIYRYYIFITHPDVCDDILSISCKFGKPLRISWSCRRRTSAVRYRSACVKPLNCTSRCCLCLTQDVDVASARNIQQLIRLLVKTWCAVLCIRIMLHTCIYIYVYIYIYCIYIYIVCVFLYTSYCIWPQNRNYKMLKVPSSKSTHLSP